MGLIHVANKLNPAGEGLGGLAQWPEWGIFKHDELRYKDVLLGI